MTQKLLGTAALVLLCTLHAGAQESALFIAQPNEIIKLADLNEDGDFLDFAEMSLYAEDLPASLGAIDGNTDRLFVLVPDAAEILIIEDLNADGDALDFAEVALYAELPNATPPPVAAGLACHPDGTLLTAELTANVLYRATDLNGDGDALDANEVLQVAADLTAPSAVTVRPDERLLVAQQSPAVPVRILHDGNADGDFLDFAENLSYAEGISPGDDITAPSDDLAYMTRPAEGSIIKLHDLNGDNDVLDFAEVVPYAENLISPTAVTHENADSLFVTAQQSRLVSSRFSAGTIYHVRDLNADGDAFDYAEVLVVAEGLNQPTAVVFVTTGCLKGDVNDDGFVDIDDVPPFVEVLLGTVTLPDPCPADMNKDGRIDGADVQPFIDELVL